MMAAAWFTVLCLVLTATNKALGSDPTTLKVTTVLTQPFARYISPTALPHELEGYVMDILHEMERDPDMADITFAVSPVEDGKYGSYVDGRWNGMIRKLRDGTADLAAAALTKTPHRSSAVTFLSPAFMTFDLAMLMKKGNVSSAIQSFDDLNSESISKYKFGVVEGGSTARYFSISARYYYLFARMSYVRNVEEGVRRVRESNDSHPYIFIGEKPMLDYHASQQPCDLIVVKGNVTDYNGGRRPGEYHLAVRRNTSWNIRYKLEAALSKLNETGRLEALYNRWWIESSQCHVPTTTGAPTTKAATPEAPTTKAATPGAATTGAPIIQAPASYH